jgi:hypothetical protein
MTLLRQVFQYAQISLSRSFHDVRPYETFTKKPITNRRYGNKSRYHERGTFLAIHLQGLLNPNSIVIRSLSIRSGLMPRLNDQSNEVKSARVVGKRPNDFHPKKALFGQNDYIDILGNGSIKPHELLREMPWWLRGFKEGEELHMLQRMQVVKEESWRWNRPQKWKEIQSRIDFLYK